MPGSWFVRRGDQEKGPFSSSKLRQLAASGRLRPEDAIRKDGHQEWVNASAVRGLFIQRIELPSAGPCDTKTLIEGSANTATVLPQETKDSGNNAETLNSVISSRCENPVTGFRHPIVNLLKLMGGVIVALIVLSVLVVNVGKTVRKRLRPEIIVRIGTVEPGSDLATR
jgi:hypothetical protein